MNYDVIKLTNTLYEEVSAHDHFHSLLGLQLGICRRTSRLV